MGYRIIHQRRLHRMLKSGLSVVVLGLLAPLLIAACGGDETTQTAQPAVTPAPAVAVTAETPTSVVPAATETPAPATAVIPSPTTPPATTDVAPASTPAPEPTAMPDMPTQPPAATAMASTSTPAPEPTAMPSKPASLMDQESTVSLTVALDELNGSGQSGWATLTAMGDQTKVELTLSEGTLETELVHIHEGQCDTLGGVAHSLTSFVDGSGSSVTMVDGSMESLMTGGFAVNSHKQGDPGVYTACGNIPAKGDSLTVKVSPMFNADIKSFTHQDITVNAGTTVVWINRDAVQHTTTHQGGDWDSDWLANGQSFGYTFTEPGTFDYFCDIHPSMTATVTVTPG